MVEDVSFAVDDYELNVVTVCDFVGCGLEEKSDVGPFDVVGAYDELVLTDG